jgi:UDP:flavonoid glycosyltransferase YjiC (YdhE family)
MRMLFTSWAWPSHFFPMVPLAWACRAAGHDVRVASQPALRGEIERAGLAGVEVGRDVDGDIMVRHDHPEITLLDPRTNAAGHVWSDIERARWQIMNDIFSRLAECMVDDLVALVRVWGPDLIVSDPTTFAGSVAAAVGEVPDARLLFGPDVTGPRGQELDLQLRSPAFCRLFERFGVEPRNDLARWTIDPCPPGMRTPTVVDRLPMRYIPYSGGYTVPGWLRAPVERPRICVTWGTFQLQIAHEDTVKVPQVLEAAGDLDVDVVVLGAGRYRHRLVHVPDNARIFDYVPVSMVLPTCAAVVHQGGPGNTLTAATHGLPQLLFPQVADQGITAERLVASGAGIALEPAQADASTVRAAIEKLLGDDGYRRAAAALRDEILRQPTPADVARELERRVAA